MEFRMSDKVYNILCWIVRLVIPAASTLYFTLSELWGFPYAAQICGTLAAIDTFMAVILGISTANYKASLEANQEVEQ